jgi:mannose-6-phosphate isomerase-like protein (cupin superfamily)
MQQVQHAHVFPVEMGWSDLGSFEVLAQMERLFAGPVYRPWGHYDALHESHHYQVKRLTILPGRSISLQRHQHRAEHWVVVEGRAHVTRDGEQLTLDANEAAYIPALQWHRLANAHASENLVVIEVQTGSYLGEDDIERA